MNKIEAVGSYRGVVLEHGVSCTQASGYPQLVLSLQALEYWDETDKEWVSWEGVEECQITSYNVLFGKDDKELLSVRQCMRVFGWDGSSFHVLNEAIVDGETRVQFLVQENEYNGKVSLQVSRLSEYSDEPGMRLRTLDEGELRDLDKRYASALRKVAGVKPIKPSAPIVAPAIAPPAKEKPKPPAKKKPKPPVKAEAAPTEDDGCTMEEAWNSCVQAAEANPDITEDRLGEIWLDALGSIAPDGDESKMTRSHWVQVMNAVISQLQ